MAKIKLSYFLLLPFLFSKLYAGEISILSYNVENLFDPSFATAKKDWTYMPIAHPDKQKYCLEKKYGVKQCLKTDWTESKFNTKLNNIAKIIKSYSQQPDILALVEVEDYHAVGKLANILGYNQYIITNSPDVRGVNVALLYKASDQLQFIASSEVDLNIPGHPSRNILVADFLVNSKPLSLFINHWPSQHQSVQTRLKAASLIKEVIDNKLAENNKTNVIVMGDFNTIDSDRPYPFDIFTNSETNKLFDVDAQYRKSRNLSSLEKNKQPLGSYFFPKDMSWNLLDHFFVNKNLLNGSDLHLDLVSYKIHAPVFAKTDYLYNEDANYPIDSTDSRYGTIIKNTPINFNFSTENMDQIGYSDHFPIAVKILW